ncbi:Bgt-51803 [Blumeria graminis f. sp. tritici]|uniref:Bgt-51803 n=1 Tax=Blumeria graminis f. sp. tritici TaxID=62690 RepID=A0A9X9MEA7_BLUGR|nr:Bgt-51803 [Blumeria graminis f. sp. tritici]
MKTRREWAEAHHHWTCEYWTSVLWTDKTWVEDGRYSREWVTRSTSQGYNADCVVEKSKRVGWMFCSCFAGLVNGPCFFWEKEWRSFFFII